MAAVTSSKTPVTLPIDTPYNQKSALVSLTNAVECLKSRRYPAIISHSLPWWVWVVESLPLPCVWNASYCYRMDSEIKNQRNTTLWFPWLQEGALPATNHGRGVRVCVCVCVYVCKAIPLPYGDQKYQMCSSSSGQPASSWPSAAAYKHEFAIAVVPRERGVS